MTNETPYPAALHGAMGELAFRDDLTGLFNRRLLTSFFEQWWSATAGACGRISLIMLDLDGFKAVNDTHGHLAGDEVLRATAEVLRRHFRADDLLIRFGGDEFLIVLPGVGRNDAGGLAERARRAMLTLGQAPEVRNANVGSPVSFSVGVASWPEDGESGEQVLAAADRRLFADKRRRTHRVGERTRRLLATGLTAAVVAAGVILGLRAGRIRPAPVELSAVSETGNGSTAADAAEFVRREAELLGQIAGLKAQLEAMSRQSVPIDRREERQAESDALEATIRRLEEQLRQRADSVPGGVAPTPRPAVASAPPSTVQAALPGDSEGLEAQAAQPAAAPVVVLPVLVRALPPRYPETAQRLQRETQVELVVLVDETGRVVRAEPAGAPAGLGFDEAAREAALRSEFLPGTRDGTPAAMETRLTVQFRLGRVR